MSANLDEIDGFGTAIAHITVQKADGSLKHYYSMPWIKLTDIKTRKRINNIMKEYLARPGEHYVECQGHPIPFLRARRRRKKWQF